MKELKLRGYVTPADCNGDIQAALDLAMQLDINKVILTGNCSASAPLVISGGMYLVLEQCVLTADIITKAQENYSFRDQFITIEGSNATVKGNIHLFNVHHVTVRGLQLQGDMTFEYTLWGNVFDTCFTGGSLKLGRGCGNFIVQRISGDQPAYIDGSISCGKVIPGSKPDIQSIILQDSCFTTAQPAVILGAAEDCGVMNIQVDHIKAPNVAVQIGQGLQQPEHMFFNLTLTDLDAPTPIDYQNPVKHVYVK